MGAKRNKIIGGLLAAVGLTASLMQATPAAAYEPAQLVNENSGLCLEIADWRTDNGAPARQWPCTGGANQAWFVNWQSPSAYTFVNSHSGKCLEIGGFSYDNGAPAQQWDCNGGSNQNWYRTTSDHLISNWNSGKCLEIGGWSTAWGAGANQWSCGIPKQANQLWTIR
ncbi:RICIN domain-containing protein [Saccharothrix sp. ST-888]|uniref:RICIN domain-containing protein n=1 Tax=Saccharothrix sp. ST-888 TaxID=1427391 RepID=UPI0006980F5C|nr:RICIN domain-containing protein [Saccharothrix sp. ST-888]